MTIVMLVITAGAFLWSWTRDNSKSKDSLKFALNMAKQSGPTLLSVLALVSLLLAYLPPDAIHQYLGQESSFSMLIGALFGSITILPGFVAFPLAASLLQRGAFFGAVAAFITTLTMVGLATLPLEMRYFGRRFTLTRNTISFLMALVIAVGMVVLI